MLLASGNGPCRWKTVACPAGATSLHPFFLIPSTHRRSIFFSIRPGGVSNWKVGLADWKKHHRGKALETTRVCPLEMRGSWNTQPDCCRYPKSLDSLSSTLTAVGEKQFFHIGGRKKCGRVFFCHFLKRPLGRRWSPKMELCSFLR